MLKNTVVIIDIYKNWNLWKFFDRNGLVYLKAEFREVNIKYLLWKKFRMLKIA